MSVDDYIMDYKFMMFLVPSQRYFKLVFDYSYFLYSYNKNVVKFMLNYYFKEYKYSRLKNMRKLCMCFFVFIIFIY